MMPAFSTENKNIYEEFLMAIKIIRYSNDVQSINYRNSFEDTNTRGEGIMMESFQSDINHIVVIKKI